MKRYYILIAVIFVLLLTNKLYSFDAFLYRSIAIDETGQLIPDTSIDVIVSFINSQGEIFNEVHNDIETDQFSIFSVRVGEGNRVRGDFDGIHLTADTKIKIIIKYKNKLILSVVKNLTDIYNDAMNNAWNLGGNKGTSLLDNYIGTGDGVEFELAVKNNKQTQNSLIFEPNGSLRREKQGIVEGGSRGSDAVDLQISRLQSDKIASGWCSVISGGRNNKAEESFTTVGGGWQNTAGASYSTVGGGGNNNATGSHSIVGGGYENDASGLSSAVVGGESNKTAGVFAFIGGGNANEANGSHAIVNGGSNNKANGDYSTVSGGSGNTAVGANTTVAGGLNNSASGLHAAVGGGEGNQAQSENSTVCGGWYNNISGENSVIGGGSQNTIYKKNSTIAGGERNMVNDEIGFIGGGMLNNAKGYATTVCGGYDNKAENRFSTIVGGDRNIISADRSFIGAGAVNRITGHTSFIGCGQDNVASNAYSIIVGGHGNRASGQTGFIGGGHGNTASGYDTFIGGGGSNKATQRKAIVVGGRENTADAEFSFIVGGMNAYTDKMGQFAQSSGKFETDGDAQSSVFIERIETDSVNHYNSYMYLGGGKYGHVTMTVPNGGMWTFHIMIIAKNEDGSEYGSFVYNGMVSRNGGTMNIRGLKTTELARTSRIYRPDVITANNSLILRVSSDNIKVRWVARIETVEVIW